MNTTRESTSPPTAPRGSEVVWLYGVTAVDLALPASCPASVEVLRHGPLAAVIERLPAAEFSSEALEARLQSVESVAALARRHQMVLDAVMRESTVIPARLCTLFSGPAAVEAVLDAGATQLSATLTRLTGCQEWGLKILCDEERTITAIEAHLTAADGEASAGTAYVLAKQRRARAVELAAERIEEVVDEVISAIEPRFIEAVERPSPRGARDAQPAVAANLSLLLACGDEEALRADLESLAGCFVEEGFRFELSGPWPPYGFCDAEARDAAEETPPSARHERG